MGGSLQSVKDFALAYGKKGLPLHILINNAVVMANPFTLTVDGIESQFATNHVGHFLLTKLLLPLLESSAPSRVVSVSSAASFMPDGFPGFLPAGFNVTDIYKESEATYTPWTAYGRSKLSNVLFASGLDRRLDGKKVYVNSCHPGGIKTNLGRHAMIDFKKSMGEQMADMWDSFSSKYVLMSPSQGAVTQLYLATSPEVEAKDIRGKYFHPQARLTAEAKSATRENEDALWDVSEKLIA